MMAKFYLATGIIPMLFLLWQVSAVKNKIKNPISKKEKTSTFLLNFYAFSRHTAKVSCY